VIYVIILVDIGRNAGFGAFAEMQNSKRNIAGCKDSQNKRGDDIKALFY